MQKILLPLTLFAMILVSLPLSTQACDKIIKNPKSPKTAKHTVKK